MKTSTPLLIIASAFIGGVLADHQLTFINNCDQKMKPGRYDGVVAPNWLGKGEKWPSTVPDIWSGAKFYMYDNANCKETIGGKPNIDGKGCTVGECSLLANGHSQCNLSGAGGFSVPASLTFAGQTRTCLSLADPLCFPAGETCISRNCLMQDNSATAAIQLTYCP